MSLKRILLLVCLVLLVNSIFPSRHRYEDFLEMEEFVVYDEENEVESQIRSDDFYFEYEQNKERMYFYAFDQGQLYRHAPSSDNNEFELFLSKDFFVEYGFSLDSNFGNVWNDQDFMYFNEIDSNNVCLFGLYKLDLKLKEVVRLNKLDDFDFCKHEGFESNLFKKDFALRFVSTDLENDLKRLNKLQIFSFELDKIFKNVVLDHGVFFGSFEDDSCPMPAVYSRGGSIIVDTYVDCEKDEIIRKEIVL